MNASRSLLTLALALTLPACASTRRGAHPETVEIPPVDPGATAEARPVTDATGTITALPVPPGGGGTTKLDPERLACDPLPAVYFEYDRSDLTVEASEAVARLGTCLKERAVRTATIEAFADERGSADYNVALSQRRGDEVRQTLERAGLPARLTVVPWGAAFPASIGHGEEHWRLNRRATVKLPGELLVDGRQRVK